MSEAVSALQRASNRRLQNEAAKVGRAEPHPVDPRNDRDAGSRQRAIRRHGANAPQITDAGSITVSRAPLVHEVTTGESVKFDRQMPGESPVKILPVEDRRRSEKGQEVTIKAETVQKHVDFLTTYVASWNRLATLPPPAGSTATNMLDHLFQAGGEFADKALLDKLSVEKRHPDGRLITRDVVSEAQIREFLKSGDAWGETIMAMEQFALMSEMALGIETTINHKIYNRQSDDSLRHRQTIAEEDLKTLRGLMKTGISNSLTAIGAIGYVLGGRGKTEYDFVHRQKVIDLIKASTTPEDKAIIWALTGVDLMRLQRNPPGTGDYAPVQGGITNVQNIERGLTNVYTARKELYVTLGLGETPTNHGGWTRHRDVDRTRDIRTLQEFIYQEAQGRLGDGGRRPEGSLFAADMQVMLEFGVLYDAAAASGTNPTEFQQLQMMDHALTTVRIRFARRRADLEHSTTSERRQSESLRDLREKRRQMDGSEFRKNRTEQHTKRQQKAEEAKAEAITRRDALQESIGDGEQQVAAKQNELLSPDFGVAYTGGDIGAAVRARILVLETDVTAARNALQPHLNTRNGEINTRLDEIRNRWQATITALGGGKVGNIPYPTEDLAAEQARIEALHAPTIAPYQAAYDRVLQQLTGLRERYAEYQSALSNLNNEVHKIVARSADRDPIIQAETTRNSLTTPPITVTIAGTAVPLNPANLHRLSTREIALALPVPPPPAPPPPWGRSEAERIQYVLRAKSYEAMTRTAILTADQTTALSALAGLTPGITIDDVLRMPQIDVVNAQIAAGIAATTAQENARNAYEAALLQRRRLEQAKVEQEISHQDVVINDAKEQIRNLENTDGAKHQVDAAIAVMGGQGELFSTVKSIADIPQGGPGADGDRLNPLGNMNPINTADTTLTQAERDSGLPQGVLEWYGLLYPGYQTATNRQELFEAMQANLPHQRLGEIINDTLGMGVAAAPPNTFTARVLLAFSTSATFGPRPTQADMIRVVRAMVTHIQSVAQAV